MMALWTQAAQDAALKEVLNLHIQVDVMNVQPVLELAMHAQLMELWITDVLQLKDTVEIPCGYPQTVEKRPIAENRSQIRYAPEADFGINPGGVFPDLKPDTEGTAYLHNHGYTPNQIARMSYKKRSDISSALAQKLGKSVTF